MKYQRKPEIVEAIQWFKHGDHPQVKRHWSDFEFEYCEKNCGQKAFHGMIETGEGPFGLSLVCPGDWIITAPNGDIGVVKDSEFREMYEVVGKPYRYENQRKLPATYNYKKAE